MGPVMYKDLNRAIRGQRIGLAIVVSASSLVTAVGPGAPEVAVAAERMVLCEEFTNQWCYNCSFAGPALGNLLDVYGDSFAFVQYHLEDGYALPWGDARAGFYSTEHTPTAIFDGTDLVEGSLPDIDQQYNVYRVNHFLPQRAVATDVTIDLSAAHVSGQTYAVTAQVGIEAGGTGKTMRIYMVQVLDNWPDSPAYSRNTFKQAAPTQDITLSPGASQAVEHEFTFDTDSWNNQENIKIVAWAQAPTGSGPAEVYQAATRAWALVALPDDIDGDGFLDGVDNCPLRYNPGQGDADGDDVGDLCDNCAGDINPDQADGDEDRIGDICDNCPGMHHLNQDDNDTDGVGNVCDWCPDVVAPGGVHPDGRSLGTIDLDCDVDADDELRFLGCFGTEPPGGCAPEDFARSDLDGDGDVDENDETIFYLNWTGPLEGPALYTGASACSACHLANHRDWLGTIHATAFDTLVASGDGDNPLCFPCHSVGFGTASGFVDLDTTAYLAGVQCENCHGPGSTHVADPINVRADVNMDSALCGACHQSCHGLCGEDHHPQFEQWSESKHSTALVDLQADPDAEDDCLQCHSTDYRFAPVWDKPTLAEVAYDLECVACHDQHGSPYVAQLHQPPRLLCAECHTTENAVPGEEPLQTQTETLHGFGGFELDGTPLYGPYTEHWWGIPNECAACHVYSEPYGGPDQPVNSGHTFAANMRACEPCHSEAVATQLVLTAWEEMEIRLGVIARYFDPLDPLYVDPAGLPPGELARYNVAKFDYEFVRADRSYGSHNANYARALLSETESFFDIPPWSPWGTKRRVVPDRVGGPLRFNTRLEVRR